MISLSTEILINFNKNHLPKPMFSGKFSTGFRFKTHFGVEEKSYWENSRGLQIQFSEIGADDRRFYSINIRRALLSGKGYSICFAVALATLSPKYLATTFKAISIPAEMPAEVNKLPSSTK